MIQIENQRFNDVINFLIFSKKVRNKRDFAQKLGVNSHNIYDVLNHKSRISDKILKYSENVFGINKSYILYGEGEMLSENDSQNIVQQGNNKNYDYNKEGIPLIPIEAMAGFGTGEIQTLVYECERFVVPKFKDAEFLIPVKGSSMYPKYSSGDIVACKKIGSWTFFQWNKVYVLDTTQGALIKRVKQSTIEGHILIVSDNPSYEPFDLPLSEIYAVAIVVGVIREE